MFASKKLSSEEKASYSIAEAQKAITAIFTNPSNHKKVWGADCIRTQWDIDSIIAKGIGDKSINTSSGPAGCAMKESVDAVTPKFSEKPGVYICRVGYGEHRLFYMLSINEKAERQILFTQAYDGTYTLSQSVLGYNKAEIAAKKHSNRNIVDGDKTEISESFVSNYCQGRWLSVKETKEFEVALINYARDRVSLNNIACAKFENQYVGVVTKGREKRAFDDVPNLLQDRMNEYVVSAIVKTYREKEIKQTEVLRSKLAM